jgi:carbon-monoxide dehydrogenase medium subunit
LTTDLKADEIVTDVEFQHLSPATGWAFEEVARRAGDFALAAVGVTMLAREGTADRVRIGLMGVGDTPMRAPEAEGLLAGRAIDAGALEAAGTAIEAAVEPNSDLHASADYRRFLAGALARRAIGAAWRRACGALP